MPEGAPPPSGTSSMTWEAISLMSLARMGIGGVLKCESPAWGRGWGVAVEGQCVGRVTCRERDPEQQNTAQKKLSSKRS